jgi:signal peptidase I
MANPEPELPRGRRVVREVGYYAILIAALLAFRSTLAENYVIPSGSMEPTLKKGDYVFALKCAYTLRVPFTGTVLARFGDVQRGDIVIFPSKEPPSLWFGVLPVRTKLIKRVVGVPGDSISVQMNRLIVNGEMLPREPYPDRAVLYDVPDVGGKTLSVETMGPRRHFVLTQQSARIVPLAQPLFVDGLHDNFRPFTVPPGMLFVMGDNRDNSFDSRFWGFVPADSVLGRAGIIYLSLDKERGFPNWRLRFERLGRIVR